MTSSTDQLACELELGTPAPGDTLIGRTVERDTLDRGDGKYPVVTVQTDACDVVDDDITVWRDASGRRRRPGRP